MLVGWEGKRETDGGNIVSSVGLPRPPEGGKDIKTKKDGPLLFPLCDAEGQKVSSEKGKRLYGWVSPDASSNE